MVSIARFSPVIVDRPIDFKNADAVSRVFFPQSSRTFGALATRAPAVRQWAVAPDRHHNPITPVIPLHAPLGAFCFNFS